MSDIALHARTGLLPLSAADQRNPVSARITLEMQQLMQACLERRRKAGRSCYRLWAPYPRNLTGKVKVDDLISALDSFLELPSEEDDCPFTVRPARHGWVVSTFHSSICDQLLDKTVELKLPHRPSKSPLSSSKQLQSPNLETFSISFEWKKSVHFGDRVCLVGLPGDFTRQDCLDLLGVLGGTYSHFDFHRRKSVLEVWYTRFPLYFYDEATSSLRSSAALFPEEEPVSFIFRKRLRCSRCKRAGHSPTSCPFQHGENPSSWADLVRGNSVASPDHASPSRPNSDLDILSSAAAQRLPSTGSSSSGSSAVAQRLPPTGSPSTGSAQRSVKSSSSPPAPSKKTRAAGRSNQPKVDPARSTTHGTRRKSDCVAASDSSSTRSSSSSSDSLPLPSSKKQKSSPSADVSQAPSAGQGQFHPVSRAAPANRSPPTQPVKTTSGQFGSLHHDQMGHPSDSEDDCMVDDGSLSSPEAPSTQPRGNPQ